MGVLAACIYATLEAVNTGRSQITAVVVNRTFDCELPAVGSDDSIVGSWTGDRSWSCTCASGGQRAGGARAWWGPVWVLKDCQSVWTAAILCCVVGAEHVAVAVARYVGTRSKAVPAIASASGQQIEHGHSAMTYSALYSVPKYWKPLQ